MVDGAIAKFAKENALLSQLFVIDNKTPIAEVVAKAGKEPGTPISLSSYVRFQLGEGIEKEQNDLSADDDAAVGGAGTARKNVWLGKSGAVGVGQGGTRKHRNKK